MSNEMLPFWIILLNRENCQKNGFNNQCSTMNFICVFEKIVLDVRLSWRENRDETKAMIKEFAIVLVIAARVVVEESCFVGKLIDFDLLEIYFVI
jgi:hypothetical protein